MVLAMRLASTSASARHARPPTNSAAGSSPVRISAREAIWPSSGAVPADGGTAGAGSAPSDQLTSAGSTSVAT